MAKEELNEELKELKDKLDDADFTNMLNKLKLRRYKEKDLDALEIENLALRSEIDNLSVSENHITRVKSALVDSIMSRDSLSAQIYKMQEEMDAKDEKLESSQRIMKQVLSLKKTILENRKEIKTLKDENSELREKLKRPIDTLEYDNAQKESGKLREKLFETASIVEELVGENNRLQRELSIKKSDEVNDNDENYLKKYFPVGSYFKYKNSYYTVKGHIINDSVVGIRVVKYNNNTFKFEQLIEIDELEPMLSECRFSDGRVGRI